jgi:hypothetical protein
MGGREEGTATDWVIGSLVRSREGYTAVRFRVLDLACVGLLLETSGAFGPFGLPRVGLWACFV